MPPRRVITGRSQEPRRRYAEELRLLRAERELSLRQLAETVGWDPSLFGKLESGATLGGPEVAQALDAFYGTPGLLLAMWEVAVADPMQFKERFRRYMALEAEAISLWHYGGSTIHGLLQTPQYARELLGAGGLEKGELDQQVEARMGRREVLERDDASPFRVILSEAVLCNSLRCDRDWREQVRYLLEVAERSNVTLYVVPYGTGLHGLMDTPVTFLRLPDGRTVAYAENVLRGELIEETSRVEDLQRRYDAIRDLALGPAESRMFMLRILEEVP
ncbi:MULTISPECIES: helix-turn-helix domain-containing protein [Streptomyces]|uniref:Helix-turn-helix transcriptional regulator n=1 Tax=Streptomyces doudnae TaxID=3075536 RepID=A0ABD5EV24_9ACTN|nr:MULTISPECIES: helix-turn-helix transcriptional regulator [unclassified Streptomyces]MDT0438566.1 helix-turn-helix transcriptional regulator [Streptomyces sp. DSM 41981]MYQ68564.1 helix-turn-helix domain-containing protein [Streptomyces sp. SID4950]SCE47200.1 Helix-turn-helix domain-containing protein [Streptomyces sp. SolWspMP-5a-2]